MIDWERVARAETHPDRLRILEAIDRAEEPLSAKGVAVVLDLTISTASYHCRAAAASKPALLVVDRTAHVRGALQTFYRLAS